MKARKHLTKKQVGCILSKKDIDELNKYQIEAMFENFSHSGLIEFEEMAGLYIENIYDFLNK